jgi:hypothetical protein
MLRVFGKYIWLLNKLILGIYIMTLGSIKHMEDDDIIADLKHTISVQYELTQNSFGFTKNNPFGDIVTPIMFVLEYRIESGFAAVTPIMLISEPTS